MYNLQDYQQCVAAREEERTCRVVRKSLWKNRVHKQRVHGVGS